LESSKISDLAHIKYNIVSTTILYYLSTLTNLNQIPFCRTSTSSNPIDIRRKLPKDWKLPSKGEESTKRTHKKIFRKVLPKIRLRQKHSQLKKLVVGISKPKYKTTKPKIIFIPLISDRNQ
jgi:hypothetical protein